FRCTSMLFQCRTHIRYYNIQFFYFLLLLECLFLHCSAVRYNVSLNCAYSFGNLYQPLSPPVDVKSKLSGLSYSFSASVTFLTIVSISCLPCDKSILLVSV